MEEHIAYLEDEYNPDEIMELVGKPSGLYFEIKRKDQFKVQQWVNWSEKLQMYVYRDKDYDKIIGLLGSYIPEPVNNNHYIASKLAEMKIYSYKIDEDMVTAFGDVDLKYQTFDKLPVKFKLVKGNFKIINSDLSTLENFPIKVDGDFNVSYNRLTSLKDGPKEVKGSYNCSHNFLRDLMGSPMDVDAFDCSHNKLNDLKYGPSYCEKDFNCSHNMMTSIRQAPIIVKGIFDCSYNKIKTFNGLPKESIRVIV
jgi:hypothetical protein